ncbi:hypothetical protein JG687_00008446 [Phytophthora cactorum]|uniref:Uncharacterized protein n=1 Tax=Phytophthora cactorum TaxID=29920 RepID=A0A8T1UET2_9STRA|nr:hypothetical protein JG687_00008446 [Phytophthora cactorum]
MRWSNSINRRNRLCRPIYPHLATRVTTSRIKWVVSPPRKLGSGRRETKRAID